MCKLEKVLPPGAFDIQLHLVCHLVEEIEIAGTVHARWMYWVERYMKVLKGYVRQKARPEGSIAAGHLHAEALFYCTGTLSKLDNRIPTTWEEAQDERETGLVLLGSAKNRTLSALEMQQIHNYIMNNDPRMLPLLERYETYRSTLTIDLQAEIHETFKEWAIQDTKQTIHESGTIYAMDEDIRAICHGPSLLAMSYTHCYESGRHFRIRKIDENRRATTDSGVCALGVMEDGSTTSFYGIIQDILEVEFLNFKVVLFGCDWFKIIEEGIHQTLVDDKCGFKRLKTHSSNILSKRHPMDDVWIYPSQVDQCFYVPMTRRDPHWSLVVPVWPRKDYQ